MLARYAHTASGLVGTLKARVTRDDTGADVLAWTTAGITERTAQGGAGGYLYELVFTAPTPAVDLLVEWDPGDGILAAETIYASQQVRPSVAGDAMTLTTGERTTLTAAIWGALTSGLTGVGSVGAYVLAKLGLITTTSVTVQSPVSAAGTVTVEQGDSYPVAHGRVGIPFSVVDATHSLGLDGADCTVSLRLAQATWEAASVTETVAGYDVVFTPTVAETAALTGTRQTYKMVATYDGTPDDVTTLARGTLALSRDIPAVP